MDTISIQNLAQRGAQSIYSYIERTAEPAAIGTRWQTLDYDNKLQYNPSVFNGVAGISLFLADYYRLTGDERASELARGACQWSLQPEHEGFSRGLCIGRTGIGMACLHAAQELGDDDLMQACLPIAQTLLDEAPGPVTDILGGAAGNGIYLLRLWQATQNERYLQGAIRNGEWLEGQALHRDEGVYWPFWTDKSEDETWYALGFAHGTSGTTHFLLHLYEATQDKRWSQLAEAALRLLDAQAQPDQGGLNWPPSLDEPEAPRCQWCHGAPGIGLTYVKAAATLGEDPYKQTAIAAGETTFQHGDIRENPSQCHGLAGNGELFIELYRLSGDKLWLDRAADFAERSFSYHKEEEDGPLWGADEPGFFSPDFLCGAAGTGHFFLRLRSPDTLRMPLF